MATDKEFLYSVMDSLYGVPDVRFKQMMGEYIIYYRDKTVGGLYDNRFLVKKTASSASLLEGAPEEIPYPGAKKMLRVENTAEGEFLKKLFEAIYSDLTGRKNQ